MIVQSLNYSLFSSMVLSVAMATAHVVFSRCVPGFVWEFGLSWRHVVIFMLASRVTCFSFFRGFGVQPLVLKMLIPNYR